MNSFRMFTPDGKFHMTPDRWGLAFLLSLCGIFLMLDITQEHLNDTVTTVFLSIIFVSLPLSMIAGATLMIINFNRYEPLHGKLEGEILFTRDRIVAGEKTHFLNELSKLSIEIKDYKGLQGYYKSLNPKFSQGVANQILLHGTEGKAVKYFFQLPHLKEIDNVREELIAYYYAGKLHWINLLDALRISDYEAIQAFKKELAIKQPQ